MALSNETNFSVTRDELIESALRLIGAIGQGESASDTQKTEASLVLNMIIKALAADGMPLWAIKENSITLIESISSYTISDPKALKIYQAWNRNTVTNVDIPMTIISIDQYNRLGNKTSSGNPIQITQIPNRLDTTVKVFPVPTITEEDSNVIYYRYQKYFDDVDDNTVDLDFPPEWFDAIRLLLAHRLAPEYGMDINDRRQLLQEAALAKNEALSFGTEESSIRFQVERYGY